MSVKMINGLPSLNCEDFTSYELIKKMQMIEITYGECYIINNGKPTKDGIYLIQIYICSKFRENCPMSKW